MAEGLAETGLFASLRRMLATLATLAQTRLELIGVEVEELLGHATAALLWSVAALFLAALAVLLLALTIVIAFWDGHRLLAAGLMTAACALAALLAGFAGWRRLRARPRFLAATAGEFERDAAALEREAP